MNAVAAIYFDGKTSRLHRVTLTVQGDTAFVTETADGIAEPVQRHCALAELWVSERTRHAPRKVTFPDGAYLEVSDHETFNAMLNDTGYRDSFVVRLQQSWRGALLSLFAVLLVLAVGYRYGLPAVARQLAFMIPVEAERQLGKGVLEFADKRLFLPSKLPAQRQAELAARFQNLKPPRDGSPSYHLLFRKSRIGPNAFALPSGDIIVTDEIITLMNDDDAVMGILAHELGHLHERHLTRRLIQSSAIAAAVSLLYGDVSAVIAAVPTVLLDLKYSRDAETEADDYALRMLQANGISGEHMAVAFEKLSKLAPEMSPYLSSHPGRSERIMHMRGER